MRAFLRTTATLLIVFVSAMALVTSTSAATTGTVTATVTVQNISITVTDGTVAYGTLGLGGTNDTTTGGTNDSQTATNTGNVTAAFNIKGQNSASWTLAATQGAEQYFHKFCTATCDSTPTWTALTASYQTLAGSVAASGTQLFDLQLGAPSTTADFTQQSVDVMVQIVAL